MRDKHEKRCYEVNAKKSANQGSDELISVRNNTRSRLACDSCRRKKLKCDNTTPCRTCVARKIQCTTSTASRRPGRPRHAESSSPGANGAIRTVSNGEDQTDIVAYENVAETVENSVNQDGYEDAALHLPQPFLQQDFTLQPDPLPEFDEFAMSAQGLDFMNGLWSLPPLTFDSSIDDNSFSFFDDSWLQFPGATLDKPTDRALNIMRDHFRLRSRAPSPSRVDTGQQQYSIAPNLARYDPDIINVFLNLARTHLRDSFPIFASYEAGPESRVELCLAMSAIGALYCSIPGSMKIARSLYHDSRRLLLEAYYTHQASGPDVSLSHTMTFILLELYGLCSGNKRSFEFSEVWHGSLLHTAGECLSSTSSDPRLVQDLQNSIRTIESYRVLILGLPPSMTKATDPCNLDTFTDAISPSSVSVSHESPDISDLVRIAGVIGSYNKDSRAQLWKPEFIELALDRWIRLQSQPVPLSERLLFHMTHIYLHSNIALLQRYAMIRATSQAMIDLPIELRSWISSSDYKTSRWHAEQILACMRHQPNNRANKVRLQQNSTFSESPHLSYCLYFAVVVTWYGNMSSEKGPQLDRMVLDGVELLSGLRVHVAKLLGMTLSEMLPENGLLRG